MPKLYELQNVKDFSGQLRTLWVRDGQLFENNPGGDFHVIEAAGAQMVPALVELQANFKEPGGDYVYSLADGFEAMKRGGYGTCLLAPSTDPVLDNAAVVQRISQKAAELSSGILLSGALSLGLDGKRLPAVDAMLKAGIRALSNDLCALPSSAYLRSVMEYAGQFKTRLFFTPMDASLLGKAFVHEGSYSSLLGLKGLPLAAEEIAVYQLISLATLTGCPIHLHGISSPASLALIQKAKTEGLDLSCDVAIHSLLFTHEKLLELNTNYHLIPPIRESQQREALIAGLKNGVIDAISGFHHPVHMDSKQTFIEGSEPGALSLETTWNALHTYVPELSHAEKIHKLCTSPAEILGLDLAKNLEFFLWDADSKTKITASSFAGAVQNSPLLGAELQGQILGSYLQGEWFALGV